MVKRDMEDKHETGLGLALHRRVHGHSTRLAEAGNECEMRDARCEMRTGELATRVPMVTLVTR